MKENRSTRIFYGWVIVVASFLNLFFAGVIIFYGFPVFYPAFVESLGFARAQVTQGFLLGFLIAGLPFCFAAGALVDRLLRVAPRAWSWRHVDFDWALPGRNFAYALYSRRNRAPAGWRFEK